MAWNKELDEDLEMYEDEANLRIEGKEMKEAKKRATRWNRVLKVIFIILIVVLTIILLGLIAFYAMRSTGKAKLHKTVIDMGEMNIGESMAATLPDGGDKDSHSDIENGTEPETETKRVLGKNQILYDGSVYEYNSDIITILVMGIDKNAVAVDDAGNVISSSSGILGGQADALFLVVLDSKDKTVRVIAINRNTMAEIDTYDEEGNFTGQYVRQIALQHGYGYGGVESCERQVKAVSKLFHNLPIHAYASINMGGIPILNDAIGGVTLEILEDMHKPGVDFEAGQGEHRMGKRAYDYVRERITSEFGSADLRLARQKQYITEYLRQLQSAALSDLSVVANLYSAISKYMVTDIDIDSCIYLASECVGYTFDTNIYSVPGENVMGLRYEEYYVDDKALQDLIVDIFYDPAEE